MFFLQQMCPPSRPVAERTFGCPQSGVQYMTLHLDLLLLANGALAKIQLVDGRGSTRCEVSTRPYDPHGLCLIGREHAVVTYAGYRKIQMMHVRQDRLILRSVLDVKALVWGVTSCGDHIVVSYRRPPWLEMMSTKGRVLRQFHDAGKTKPFRTPDFLTTSKEGFIYVTDFAMNTISKLDSSLVVLQTFSSPHLIGPRGITPVGSDRLLVCSLYNRSIVQVNANSGKVAVILDEQDGIVAPRSLSFCPMQRKLFLCSELNTKDIQVYLIE